MDILRKRNFNSLVGRMYAITPLLEQIISDGESKIVEINNKIKATQDNAEAEVVEIQSRTEEAIGDYLAEVKEISSHTRVAAKLLDVLDSRDSK